MPRRSRPDDRSFVLAIDLGTSSVRTALFDEMARVVPGSRARQVYGVRYSVEHGAELDPAALLPATRRCLRQTQSGLTKSFAPVIAGSGFWHSMLGVDRAGEPLTPIYTWADTRSAEDAARLRKQLDERDDSATHRLHAARFLLAGQARLAAPYPASPLSPRCPLGFAG